MHTKPTAAKRGLARMDGFWGGGGLVGEIKVRILSVTPIVLLPLVVHRKPDPTAFEVGSSPSVQTVPPACGKTVGGTPPITHSTPVQAMGFSTSYIEVIPWRSSL